MRFPTALLCAALFLPAPAAALPIKSEAAQQLEFGVKMALKGSWREAAFRFGRSIKADPENPLAHNNLGVALESVGEFERALAAYKRARELDPENERIRENMDRLQAYLEGRGRPLKPVPPGSAPARPPQPPPVDESTPPVTAPRPADPPPPAGGGR